LSSLLNGIKVGGAHLLDTASKLPLFSIFDLKDEKLIKKQT